MASFAGKSVDSLLPVARLRSHVDRHVFVEAPPLGLTPKRVGAAVAFVVATAVVVLLRAWSVDPLHHLYAEDSYTYLAGAQDGLFSSLLDSYNGYVQLAPRLIAGLVAHLPVGSWAAAIAVVSALLVASCALVVWVTSAALVRNVWLRGALAASVALFGAAGGEMYANAVNTIWFVSFACFWLLLWRPRSTTAGAIGALLLLGGAISHSAPLFLLPLWLLRALVVRSRADALIVAGFAIGIAVQLGLSYDDIGPATHAADPLPAGAPLSTLPYWDWNLVPAFGQRVAGGVVGGYDANAFLWRELGVAYLLVLAGSCVGLVVWSLRTEATRLLVPLTVAVAIVLFLASGYVRWGAGGNLLYWPAGSSTPFAARYVFMPTMLLLSALVLQIDAVTRRATTRSAPGKWGIVVVATLAFSFVLDFHITPVPEEAPKWGVAVEQAREQCAAQGGGSAEIVGTSHSFPSVGVVSATVPVDCSRLN